MTCDACMRRYDVGRGDRILSSTDVTKAPARAGSVAVRTLDVGRSDFRIAWCNLLGMPWRLRQHGPNFLGNFLGSAFREAPADERRSSLMNDTCRVYTIFKLSEFAERNVSACRLWF